MRTPLRALLPMLLATAGLTLAACGSSGKGLIPAAQAGPLQSDFEMVAQAAERGNGDCTATREAIAKTQEDFTALPGSVDAGLRARLREGIANLSARSLALCAQPLGGVTTTSSSTTSAASSTSTTSTTSTSTSTTSSPSTPTATTPPAPGGGTPAGGESGGTPGGEGTPGNGEGNGQDNGPGGAGIGNGNGNGRGNGNGGGG